MDHLKHLSGSSGPASSRTMTEGEETVEATRKIANVQLKDKIRYISPVVQSAYLGSS